MTDKILESFFIKEMSATTSNLYRLGWDERNGGNISLLLKLEEIEPYRSCLKEGDFFKLPEALPLLAGYVLLLTGSGKYFKNIEKDPADGLALLQIDPEGKQAQLIWGLVNGGRPTSEFAAHLLSHNERLKVDPSHRAVIHTHSTHLMALTYSLQPLSEQSITHLLWEFSTECLVVFPDGVGLIPWLVPGTEEIGKATANKLAECRLCLWPYHGVYGTGKSLDEAFGLIETAEKAATVYTLVQAQGGKKNTISDTQLTELAQAFGVQPKKGILNTIAPKTRKGSVMQLNKGQEAEYKKRHDQLWTELEEVLKEYGVSNYSIFFNSATSQLFSYVEYESEEQWQAISKTKACQKWWDFMADIMQTHSDHSPVTLELKEVFHLD